MAVIHAQQNLKNKTLRNMYYGGWSVTAIPFQANY